MRRAVLCKMRWWLPLQSWSFLVDTCRPKRFLPEAQGCQAIYRAMCAYSRWKGQRQLRADTQRIRRHKTARCMRTRAQKHLDENHRKNPIDDSMRAAQYLPWSCQSALFSCPHLLARRLRFSIYTAMLTTDRSVLSQSRVGEERCGKEVWIAEDIENANGPLQGQQPLSRESGVRDACAWGGKSQRRFNIIKPIKSGAACQQCI